MIKRSYLCSFSFKVFIDVYAASHALLRSSYSIIKIQYNH